MHASEIDINSQFENTDIICQMKKKEVSPFQNCFMSQHLVKKLTMQVQDQIAHCL